MEEIFALSEVNDFDLATGEQEKIGRLQITMAQADALHMRESGYQWNKHLLNLVRLPKELRLLSLPEDVLKVLSLLNILTNDTDSVGVVHRLIEEVTVELDDVLMILSFE